MIEQWLREDIDAAFSRSERFTICDPEGVMTFLLATLNNTYLVYTASSDIEELEIKYRVEKEHADQKVILHVRRVPDDMEFLREYFETGERLQVQGLPRYVRDKVHQHLRLNLVLPDQEVIAAALQGIGKDKAYWIKLAKGVGNVINLEEELLPFLHDPKAYWKALDKEIRPLFQERVFLHLGQTAMTKPPETLAKEIMLTLFDGLVHNRPDDLLLRMYRRWLDSHDHSPSFKAYLPVYSVPTDLDPWSVHQEQPFRVLDEKALLQLLSSYSTEGLDPEKLSWIRSRAGSLSARRMGIGFWKDVLSLLEYRQPNMSRLNTLEACIRHYQDKFWPVDRAIRQLYTDFLNRPELIQPLQEIYERHLNPLLDRWFDLIDTYSSQQQGLLYRLINENPERTAIIVGDGVTLEIAQSIADQVENSIQVERDSILAGIPSITEQNMSLMFSRSGEVIDTHQKRTERLRQETGKEIRFMSLDGVHESMEASGYLICSSKDIDTLGENMQQEALRMFPDIETQTAQKIGTLLRCGFERVYLVSDHGFVLTGLLTDSDKINIQISGDHKKNERYIRTVSKIQDPPPFLFGMPLVKGPFQHIYFARSNRPFVTKGPYGYSHGGMSPQELIIPLFTFRSTLQTTAQLQVHIVNRDELLAVTGDLFTLQLMAEHQESDLFKSERRCIIRLLDGQNTITQSDVMKFEPGKMMEREFSFDGKPTLKALLLDAATLERLDEVTVTQSQARDLGGL